jgi:hypothetical protein
MKGSREPSPLGDALLCNGLSTGLLSKYAATAAPQPEDPLGLVE